MNKRLCLILGCGLFALLAIGGLAGATLAQEQVHAAPAGQQPAQGTPTPTCQPGVLCASPTPTQCPNGVCGSPTRTATRTATLTATRTATASATRTPTATPTCIILGHYTATVVPGTMVPGVEDLGNHCNDCVTGVTFP